VIAYKFLLPNGTSLFSDFRWQLPNGAPGPWVEARVDPCHSGIHACRASDLPPWVGSILFETELRGEVVELNSKLVASRGRLLRQVESWNDELSGAYTRMCAERAHELAAGASPPLEAWEAEFEPWIPEGPAVLGFVAARIAEEISGAEGFRSERARQADWLIERLGLAV
jgi:hypothetical protein